MLQIYHPAVYSDEKDAEKMHFYDIHSPHN